MKNKVKQMFRDKLVLVMLVLGLLTIVAAAGVVTIQRRGGAEENPYLSMEEDGPMAGNVEGDLAGDSEMRAETPGGQESVELAAGEPSGADGENGAGSGEIPGAGAPELEEQAAPQSAADPETEAAQAGAGNDAAAARVLNFADTDRLAWPVRGAVLIDYSMDTTTYFSTLKQYKCSPGIVVQSEVSQPVYAPAAAKVAQVGSDEELGSYVVLDLGNEYEAICGQLKEIPVAAGDYVEAGSLLGYVAEPTKYYSVEGSNVYFQLTRQGEPVDPLDYLE